MKVGYLMPGVKRIILDNGLRVLMARGPYTKKVLIMVGFQVGSIDETNENSGISHFSEHILFKSTQTRKGKQILEDLEAVGTKVNAATDVDHTTLYAKVLPQFTERVIKNFFEMVANPTYNSREFELERKVVLEELEDTKDEPIGNSFDFIFYPTLFNGTSLAQSVGGTRESLERMSKEDLEDFKKKHYLSNNTAIVVVGRFNEEEIIRNIDGTFGKLTPGSIQPQKLEVELFNSQTIKLTPRRTLSPQAYLALGYRVPGSLHRDFHKLDLLDSILSLGLSSRLFVALRERRGIGYQVGTAFNDFYTIGAFYAYVAGFNKKRFQDAVRAILGEFQNLKKKIISDRELQKAKSQHISSHEEAMEEVGFWAGQILRKEFFDVSYDFRRIPKYIEKITPRDIMETANQYLTDEYTLTALVPEGFKPF